MRQNLTKLLLLLLLILVLLLVACTEILAGSRKKSHFTNRTDAEVYTYQVRGTTASVRLYLQMNVTAGSVTWTLVDPSGAVRWEGQVSPGREVNERRDFEPIAGKWTLRMALEDASGAYDVYWTAR